MNVEIKAGCILVLLKRRSTPDVGKLSALQTHVDIEIGREVLRWTETILKDVLDVLEVFPWKRTTAI
jgi:hypothetical protein